MDLMRTKLIRDFALHNSTMMFPQDPGQHLPPIRYPPESKREPRDFFILTFFSLHVEHILQASKSWLCERSQVNGRSTVSKDKKEALLLTL